MIPLNYHHLYYFYVIARSGSIAKACEELLLAQSTLSTQLRQFEKAVGHALFERVNQRLKLTEEGRLALDYAESLFEIGNELQDALKDRPGRGRIAVQIGVLSGSPRAFGHALLEAALKKEPGALITVLDGRQEELLQGLRDHKLDMALTDVPIHSHEQEEFSNRLAGRVPVVLAAAPALARRHKGGVKKLNGAPFILPTAPSQLYMQLRNLFSVWKIKPRVVAEVQDVELARRLALEGHGIIPLNVMTANVKLPARGLTVLDPGRPTGLFEAVYVVMRKRRWPNPLADHLARHFSLSSD